MNFRKKAIIVQACRVSELLDAVDRDPAAMPEWVRTATKLGQGYGRSVLFADGYISVITLEGVMKASPTDWLIRGVEGELYPCRASIFEATYEPAS